MLITCAPDHGPNQFDMAIPYTIMRKGMKWSKDAGQKHYIQMLYQHDRVAQQTK